MSYKSNKRPRLSVASYCNISDDGQDDFLPQRPDQPRLDGDELLESSAAMIAVPVEMIFRQVMNQGQLKPLLSRSEAQTFLSINILGEQLDSLTNLNETLLKEQETSLLDNLTQDDHPQLRSLQVILSSYHERFPAWSELPNRLTAILSELERCRSVLRHCAEQNWSVSQLLSATPGTHIGMEKRKLSEIEDEICRRIQLILDGPVASERTKPDKSEKSEPMLSMEEYVKNVFHESTEQEESYANTSAELARQRSTLPSRQIVHSGPFATQKVITSWTNMDVQNNNNSLSPMSVPKPARSLAFHTQETKAALQEHDNSTDDDEILEDLVEQHNPNENDNDDSRTIKTPAEDTISQELTSPEASRKRDIEKENEPSQSSHTSSVVEDSAFRSQNAAEVLSTFRKMA